MRIRLGWLVSRGIVLGLVATAAAGMMVGCGVGTLAGGADSSATNISGIVHGGQQPVQGAMIEYYATSSAGYGGSLTPIGSATTAVDGTFTVNITGTCPSGQFGYLLGTGGNPGLASGTNNQALLLATAVGPCSGINSGTTVTINEVTTVAAVYALSGFLPKGGVGLTSALVAAGSSAPGITTSATNVQGLTDAFANAANIISAATGTANTVATASGAAGAVPQATIDSVADILQDCVNSTGASSPACVALFAAATPPAATGVAAPVNTLQAAIDIAQYPGNNVSTLFNLISSRAAFQPLLSAVPNDWTIGVTYTYPTTALVSGLGLGIDAFDNVYVTGSTGATTGTDLIAFTPQGALINAALMATTATSNNIRWIAFDKSGDAYMANGNATSIYKFAPTSAGTSAANGGTLTTLSYSTVSSTANNYALAVDGLGDVWVETYKKSTCSGNTGTLACLLIEYPVSAQTAPVVSFGTGGFQDVQPGIAGARSVAFDVKTGNVWTTDIGGGTLNLFTVVPSATAAATASAGPASFQLGTAPSSGTLGYGSVSVAIDSKSNAWGVVTGGTGVPAALYQVTPTGTVTAISGLTPATGGGLVTPAYDVIDGNGNIFIANTGASTTTSAIAEYSPAAAAYLSPGFGFSPGATYTAVSGANPATISGGTLYQASYVVVDRSGALWALSGGTGKTTSSLANLVQILGVAAPTDPVLADGNYGVRP